jgi:hypothetical protein
MKRARRTSSKHLREGRPTAPDEYDRDVQSVGYFSDGVFAIAMTLLIIGIRVPSGTSAETLGHALRGLGSSFASYGISFIVIGLYWLGYHRQLHFMERFNGGAIVIDLLFLMSVAFLPFPTAVAEQLLGLRLRDLLKRRAWPRRGSCSGFSGSTPVGVVCYGTSMCGSTPTTRFALCTLR